MDGWMDVEVTVTVACVYTTANFYIRVKMHVSDLVQLFFFFSLTVVVVVVEFRL